MPRHVGELHRLIAQPTLACEQTCGPEDAREGLVVEDPRQRLCEHGGDADLALAERPRERLTCGRGAVLDIRDQPERPRRGPAEVGRPRQPVTRARAGGASRPVTATRTGLWRPSGCWYRAVGVASITIGGAARRGRCRPASGRLPSHATKLRRSVMSG